MEGLKRREKILEMLEGSGEPIKGHELGIVLGVSRQVIVQDIALLRAQGKGIISTSEGYMAYRIKGNTCKRVLCVRHGTEQMEEELNTIVDLGGHVLNVVITHPVYGDISAAMMLRSRKNVEDFLQRALDKDFIPLMDLTGGVHYHTIEAESEEALDEIERRLIEKKLLQP
ncbi:transcription repressor NadR [Anaerotalea alkaliphila]|uniref:Transcription repressor NadR n=1 Tax=Anaerotalea alkaliphila TaxID=2662126 RepID=A0A7X5HWS7_9FIRM|nr:transcription repressor NadR [Anaerotalea alkaliphila]NDL68061.1 transcription repressor NadR [Anaerotalea alkaliphila]